MRRHSSYMAGGRRSVCGLHFEFGFNPFFDFGRLNFHLKLGDEHLMDEAKAGRLDGRHCSGDSERVSLGEKILGRLEALTMKKQFELRELEDWITRRRNWNRK